MLARMSNGTQYAQETHERSTSTISACLDAQKRTSRRLVFALSTALDLLGVEAPPPHRVRLSHAEELQIVVGDNGQRTRLRGTNAIVWKGVLETIPLMRGQLVCTSPATTWAMFALRIPLEELVVLGDAMMRRHSRERRANPADFLAMTASLRRQTEEDPGRIRTLRGIRNMELAARLMRENTDSSQETRTRLALMRYGLDEPRVNHRFYVRRTGKTLFFDMAYPELNIVIEYDGRHHAGQWLSDVKRREIIEDEGWIYIQVTASNLADEESERMLALRVASKIEQRIQRPVRLCRRLSVEQVADSRRLRKTPLHVRHAARIVLSESLEESLEGHQAEPRIVLS